MKTININLIGDLARTPQKTKIKKAVEKSDVDSTTKNLSMVITVGSLIIFILSLLIWSLVFICTNKIKGEIKDVKLRNEQIKLELAGLNSMQTNLQDEKKILDLKLLAQNQIEAVSPNWRDILVDISHAVPKTIKVTEIARTSSVDQQSLLNIKGKLNSVESNNLKLISYLVVNINNNLQQAPLYSATIKEINFDDQSKSYNFTVQAMIKVNEEPKIQDNK